MFFDLARFNVGHSNQMITSIGTSSLFYFMSMKKYQTKQHFSCINLTTNKKCNGREKQKGCTLIMFYIEKKVAKKNKIYVRKRIIRGYNKMKAVKNLFVSLVL